MAQKTARRIAVLTPYEKYVWESYFRFYVVLGMKDDEADFSTWQDMQKEFPRLQEFDGCEA